MKRSPVRARSPALTAHVGSCPGQGRDARDLEAGGGIGDGRRGRRAGCRAACGGCRGARKAPRRRPSGNSRSDPDEDPQARGASPSAQEAPPGDEGEGDVNDLRRPHAVASHEGGPRATAQADRPAEADTGGQGRDQQLRGAADPGARRKAEAGHRPRPQQRRLRPQADRPEPCGGLRLHRPAAGLALPAPVPGRLLHDPRSLDGHGQTNRLPRGGDAGQRGRHPNRPRPLPAQRRLQPRAGNRPQGAGAGHRDCAATDRGSSAQSSGPLLGARRARRR